MWIQCFYVKYGQEACMFLCTNVYEMPCTAVFCSKVHIIFKVSLRLHVQKWPRSLLCCVKCSVVLLWLEFYTCFHEQNMAKKPGLLCICCILSTAIYVIQCIFILCVVQCEKQLRDISLWKEWCALKRARFGKKTEWTVYLELVYLVTALVPSDTACLANSPGRRRRTAVWISREVMVERRL